MLDEEEEDEEEEEDSDEEAAMIRHHHNMMHHNHHHHQVRADRPCLVAEVICSFFIQRILLNKRGKINSALIVVISRCHKGVIKREAVYKGINKYYLNEAKPSKGKMHTSVSSAGKVFIGQNKLQSS